MSPTPEQTPPNPITSEEARARRTIGWLAALATAIIVVVVGLLYFPSLWEGYLVDANLFLFVAVNVNIVLLTGVFYMLLRNVIKVYYERKSPWAAVGLKTKLFVAFLALSIPSVAFHLITGVFLAQRFENWSAGEYNQVLDSARDVLTAWDRREADNLANVWSTIYTRVQHHPQALGTWTPETAPALDGMATVFNAQRQLVARWAAKPEYTRGMTRPAKDYLADGRAHMWEEETAGRQWARRVAPMPGVPGAWLEVGSVVPKKVVLARSRLAFREEAAAFMRKDLFLLVITLLVVMALIIVFAATWVAIYMARGLANPIEQLALATGRVASGELGYQVPEAQLGPMQGDFVGLVRAFNTMSAQLSEQRQQLVATTAHLRQSHQELAERTRFVELLLENIEVGIITLDRQGCLTMANHAALAILGLGPGVQNGADFPEAPPILDVVPPPTSPLGRPYREWMNPALAHLVDEMLATLATRRRAQRNFTLEFLGTVDFVGEPVHLELTLLPLPGVEGLPESTVMVLEDVTDLQRTQRAEAWREVAKRVAHEIKNPLTPIQLSAQRIRRNYLEKMGADGAVLDQCTQTIVDEVVLLKKMVNEFSQFAKLPERQARLDDLNQVVREVAQLYQNGLPEGIRLELHLDAALPAFSLDREQLKRVFTNLIDNAAAAIMAPNHREGGTITLTTRYLPRRNRVQATVADDGQGIPPEVRSRLFEPYTSTKVGGTGLGLTICYQIVSDHNGAIRYEPVAPQGTAFVMEFPTR